MIESRVIQSSRVKTAIYAALCLAFAVLGGFFIEQPGASDGWAWIMLVFFGLGALALAWSLIRPHRLLLDGTGFEMVGGLVRSPRRIAWRDIEGFFVYRLPRGGKMIGYNFTPEGRERTTLLDMNRSFGADGALPKAWPGSPEAMVRELNDYRVRALTAQA